MPYTICGLIIPQSEEGICRQRNWPFVSLASGVSLVPLANDFIFLTDGDLTDAEEVCSLLPPSWLRTMAACFSRSAYIEAAFHGGCGTQAACLWEHDHQITEPAIHPGAINFALRRMGVVEPMQATSLGVSNGEGGPDPFELVGLGRFRSVEQWLRHISVSSSRT